MAIYGAGWLRLPWKQCSIIFRILICFAFVFPSVSLWFVLFCTDDYGDWRFCCQWSHMLQLACVWVNWVAIGNRLSVACADSVWIISWIVPGFSKWIYVAFCSSLDSTSTVICSVAFFYHDIVCGKFVLNAVLYNSYRHRILTVNNWRHWSFQPYMLRCLGFFPLQ